MTWANIQYRDFYDVPRIFITDYQGGLYLFDCPFNETLDDYPDHYRVYQLPALTAADLAGSWQHLPALSSHWLGTVSVDDIQFDPTKRASINTTVFPRLLAWAMPETMLA